MATSMAVAKVKEDKCSWYVKGNTTVNISGGSTTRSTIMSMVVVPTALWVTLIL